MGFAVAPGPGGRGWGDGGGLVEVSAEGVDAVGGFAVGFGAGWGDEGDCRRGFVVRRVRGLHGLVEEGGHEGLLSSCVPWGNMGERGRLGKE